MIDFKNNNHCTGCSACVAACPYHAIGFHENEEGFSFPEVDMDKCRNCGICEKVCPLNHPGQERQAAYYAVQNKDTVQRRKSQSGGLFSAVATVILSENGVCYGAGFNENFEVIQTRIENISDLPMLQGSKYVQSAPGNTFELAAMDLKAGKKVLYSGTSCMIAGLNSFLSLKNVCRENLVTCDLICHSVSSPRLWKDNIVRQVKKNGKLVKANFRDKKNGWHSCVESYLFENGKIADEAFYTDLFYSSTASRQCCYTCEFLNLKEKPADITMGDFWGISKAEIELKDDNSGISLAVSHSAKGLDLLKKANLTVIEINEVTAMENNKRSSAKPPIWREKFWKDYRRFGYEYCLKKYSIYGGGAIQNETETPEGHWKMVIQYVTVQQGVSARCFL